MKAVICAIAKYEYDYIKEWVEYHIKLGFDKIVIYDNNDIEGEKYDELLKKYIKAGQVEIRDVRGKRAMQRVVYNEFYHEGDFDWLAIIDIDEFIAPNRTKYKNIKEFIEKNSSADAIFLYWQTYGDAGKTYPTKSTKPISVLKQYNIPCNKNSIIDNALRKQNAWGKSIIKAGLPIKFLHEHFVVDPNDLNYVDCFGDSVVPYYMLVDSNYIEKTYKECYVKHIYTKSLSEYINCKVRRPAANSMNPMHFPSKYFKVNEINEEKRKYMESIGYKMEFVFKPDTMLLVDLANMEEYNLLKPYIINIMRTCCCRFILRIMSSEEDVNTINRELGPYFNECIIYYDTYDNKLATLNNIYSEHYAFLMNYVNCIIHLNIPYGINYEEYIQDYVDPVFGENNLVNNLQRVFNSEDSICVALKSIVDLDTSSEEYKEYKTNILKGNLHKVDSVAFTGNFISKPSTFLKYKKEYTELCEQFSQKPETLLYFIASIHTAYLWSGRQ